MRCRSGCVSGSPSRTLNSRTLGPSGGHHQAGVEEAGEAGALDGGQDHAVENQPALLFGEDAGIGIGSHAAGVRAGVAVEDGLVVLGSRQGQSVPAIAEGDEADLFAAQEFLDDERRLEVGERGFGFRTVVGDDHALAGRQAVGFEDQGKPDAVEGGRCVGRILDINEAGGGNGGIDKEVLGEDLAALEPGGVARRSDDAQTASAVLVDNPFDEGNFRPDDGQVGLEFGGCGWGQAGGDLCHAGVAGGSKDLHTRRLRELPGKGMFPAAAADDQNFHRDSYNGSNAGEV